MDIGTLLVLIGVILAVVSMLVPAEGRYGAARPFLLPLAVFLIGLGVLFGADALFDVDTKGGGK